MVPSKGGFKGREGAFDIANKCRSEWDSIAEQNVFYLGTLDIYKLDLKSAKKANDLDFVAHIKEQMAYVKSLSKKIERQERSLEMRSRPGVYEIKRRISVSFGDMTDPRQRLADSVAKFNRETNKA